MKFEKNVSSAIIYAVIFLGVGFFCGYAHARDLVDAAQSAQSMLNKIGIAAISIGITLGGIAFAVGAAQLGRNLLISGAVGAAAVLAAPSLVNMLARMFGASV